MTDALFSVHSIHKKKVVLTFLADNQIRSIGSPKCCAHEAHVKKKSRKPEAFLNSILIMYIFESNMNGKKHYLGI